MGKPQSILCITCRTQFKPDEFVEHKETCGKGRQVTMSHSKDPENKEVFGRFQKKAIKENEKRDAETKKPTKKPTKKTDAETDKS